MPTGIATATIEAVATVHRRREPVTLDTYVSPLFDGIRQDGEVLRGPAGPRFMAVLMPWALLTSSPVNGRKQNHGRNRSYRQYGTKAVPGAGIRVPADPG